MAPVSALTLEVAPPPVIKSYAGLLPTLRAAGLVAQTWQEAVSLAVASGEFVAEWKGNVLTPDSALALKGETVLTPDPEVNEDREVPLGVEAFLRGVNVIYGSRFLSSFTFHAESQQQHRPIGCGDSAIWVPQCVADPGVAEGQVPKTISEQPDIVTQYPIQIQANDQCSTWAPDLEERKFRAITNLERHESNILANELWTGEQATANGWPNLSLSQSATDLTPASSSPLTYALGTLQENLAEGLGDGQAGIIYATRSTVEAWWAAGALYWLQYDNQASYWGANGYLVDIYNNIIVSSGGFDGSAPDGVITPGVPYAYASGPIVIRLGEMHVFPGDWYGGAPDVTRDNLFTVYAERYAGYEMDGCAVYGIGVDLCNTCCTTPGS